LFFFLKIAEEKTIFSWHYLAFSRKIKGKSPMSGGLWPELFKNIYFGEDEFQRKGELHGER
jgi:hypothetical protein